MATKAELEADLEKANKKISSLKGQVTKLKDGSSDESVVVDCARVLVHQIRDRGLTTQVGQKQVRLLMESYGEQLNAAR